MAGRLEGKISLVTGGSTGIGQACSLTLAREGAKVVVSDVNADEGEKTARLIQDSGGDAVFIRADVSEAAEVESLVHQAVKTYGRLDCAFNNAGIPGAPGVPTHEYPEKDWDRPHWNTRSRASASTR